MEAWEGYFASTGCLMLQVWRALAPTRLYLVGQTMANITEPGRNRISLAGDQRIGVLRGDRLGFAACPVAATDTGSSWAALSFDANTTAKEPEPRIADVETWVAH